MALKIKFNLTLNINKNKYYSMKPKTLIYKLIHV